jgi:hypothetical protein
MTTYLDFTPSSTSVFTFNPVLDGTAYNAQVRWNVFRQGWYLQLADTNNNLVLNQPLIGSPDPFDVSSAVWNILTQTVEVTLAEVHSFSLGQVVKMTMAGFTPVAYNGKFTLYVDSPTSLYYSQTTDPGGPSTYQGSLYNDINLVAGYFNTSTLVFRASTNQFEVNP